MAPAPAAQPFALVRLVLRPPVAAGLPATAVVGPVRLAFVPAWLVAVVTFVSGRLVRIGFVPLVRRALVATGIAAVVAFWLVALPLVAPGVVPIKLTAVWLAGHSMLG